MSLNAIKCGYFGVYATQPKEPCFSFFFLKKNTEKVYQYKIFILGYPRLIPFFRVFFLTFGVLRQKPK